MQAPRFPGFEILETMPQGGMGTVYKARQLSLDRIVALKMLAPELAADSADLDRFLTEARITANLKHPGIVQVYDFGKSEGIYFFVMEFISGYSVGEWLRRKQILSEENSLLVAQSVAVALEYAWDKDRVIHCDIKPDNIMIDGDGTVKVADLGLARSMRSVMDRKKTLPENVCGTPNYISPEQSRGDVELDLRTDIYSLGAMLYHCMTGKMPFEGEPMLQVMDLQISDQIPDPKDINPAISVESACLIEKMMAKDRDERHQDWQSVHDDISGVMDGRLPAGGLPEMGRSTIRRSAARDKQQNAKTRRGQHVKTPSLSVPRGLLVRNAPSMDNPGYGLQPSGEWADILGMATYSDEIEFEKVQQRFKKKQHRLAVPAWRAAAVIAAVILVLGIQLFRFYRARDTIETAPREETVIRADPADTGARELIAAAELFHEVLLWVKANPGKHDDAIKRFNDVAQQANGTQYAAMALEEIKRIRAAKQGAIDSVIGELDGRAEVLGEQNRYGDAAALFENYTGPHAAETAEIRRERVRSWLEQEEKFAEKKQREAIELRKAQNIQWRKTLREVAAELVDGDLESALARARAGMEQAVPGALEKEFEALKRLLVEAADMERHILDSFRAQRGREVDLMLTTGPETLTIRQVHDDHVEVEKVVAVGEGYVIRPREITVDDLAPEEQHRRLGPDDRPETALMKGLVSIMHGDTDAAETFFADVGRPLSKVLAGELGRHREALAAENARQALALLLRTVRIDIPDELPSVGNCIAAIRGKSFSGNDRAILARAVSSYRKRFEDTAFAVEYEQVLAELERAAQISSDAEPDPHLRADRPPRHWTWSDDPSVRDRLLNLNPGLSHENIRFGADASGRIVAVELRSSALRDITPLASLRDLHTAICSGRQRWERDRRTSEIAGLSDISALSGMALEELDLSGTAVRDLSALANMPLSKLDLSWTRVQDLRSLAAMPLIELDLSNSDVRDVRALYGLPLEILRINGTSIDNLAGLRDLRLSELDAGGTRLREIWTLRGMPLRSLVISDTGVMDINALRGMPLKRLDISRTQVRDISPLKDMALEELEIDGLNIKSLSVLQGMPLRHLEAGNTGISDISLLSDMPLRSLHIGNTGVRDLSILRTMPLTRLSIDSTRVNDLNALRGLKLEHLTISGTGVKNLVPLARMPLRHLDLTGTPVQDLGPIQNLPIEHIRLDEAHLRYDSNTRQAFMQVLRRMPALRTVNGHYLFEHRPDHHRDRRR